NRRQHTRSKRDYSSDVCSSDLINMALTYVHRTFNKAGIHDTSLFFIKFRMIFMIKLVVDVTKRVGWIMKIMIVEDEKPNSQILQAYFKKAGYDIIPVFRGDEAIPHIKKSLPEVLVLEVMLPGRSGWDILKNIRKEDLAPVIMLTALGEVPDRLKGLHEGADDYIPKPFVADEVVARAE